MEKNRQYAVITIKVNLEIKEALDKIKIHPREPYYEVIKRLIEGKDPKSCNHDCKYCNYNKEVCLDNV